MSLVEITSAIDQLSPEERGAIAVHLRRKFCDDSAERRDELGAIGDEMDAGKKFSLEQLRELDAKLTVEGR